MQPSDSDRAKETIVVSPLVELKRGKLIFKQKCTSFEKLSETLQEIVRFRNMLEQRIQQGAPPLTVFPDEHKPLVAKLAHESDKTLYALSKYVRQQILPAQDEDESGAAALASAALPLPTVESAILSILTRRNYGLEAPVEDVKIPPSLCVWRWEIKEEYLDWLPKAAKGKAEARIAERLQAKEDLAALVQGLSLQERDTLLKLKPGVKLAATQASGQNVLPPPHSHGSDAGPSLKQPRKQNQATNSLDVGKDSVEAENAESQASHSTKALDPETIAKEKEKLAKKIAKEEKDRKIKDAQNKSRSIMAKFFTKPKPAPRAAAVVPSARELSEFEKTFKPFVLKKDAELAPINGFVAMKERQGRCSVPNNVIVLDDADDEDVKMIGVKLNTESSLDASKMSPRARLQNALSDFARGPRPTLRPPRSSRWKTSFAVCIRTLMSELTEAEMVGSTSLVRSLLDTLSSRARIPAKILIHHDDLRPGYFGTWTRSSRIIGPRTPLAKDTLALDYGYDSGEEWEEDWNGDGEDVVEDGEEEDGDALEDVDSDLDDWLVDDDEVEEVMEEPREWTGSLPPEMPPPAQKRKLNDASKEKSLGKKRKVVVPLMPFAKGPCWEREIGTCSYDPFRPYKIHLFNDTPYPIDPFTFVAVDVPSRTALRDQRVSVTSQLPGQLANPSSLRHISASTSSLPRRAPTGTKAAFPETHLPFLLSKIATLATGNLVYLVQNIYEELRVHGVKKNAIEGKIREIGEKSKEKKIWIVKDDFAVGLPLA